MTRKSKAAPAAAASFDASPSAASRPPPRPSDAVELLRRVHGQLVETGRAVEAEVLIAIAGHAHRRLSEGDPGLSVRSPESLAAALVAISVDVDRLANRPLPRASRVGEPVPPPPEPIWPHDLAPIRAGLRALIMALRAEAKRPTGAPPMGKGAELAAWVAGALSALGFPLYGNRASLRPNVCSIAAAILSEVRRKMLDRLEEWPDCKTDAAVVARLALNDLPLSKDAVRGIVEAAQRGRAEVYGPVLWGRDHALAREFHFGECWVLQIAPGNERLSRDDTP